MLRDIIGIPNVELGAAPVTEQGKFVTQTQLAGSDNVLRGLMFAKLQLHQNLWENIMYDLIANGAQGVMNNKVFSIKEGNPDEIIPNLKVEIAPSEQQWGELYALANQALAAGTITLDQVAYLKMIDNYNQAYAYLALQEKKGKMMQMQNVTANAEANAKIQSDVAAVAQQGKENLEKIKIQGDIIKEVAKSLIQNPANANAVQAIMPLMLMFATSEQQQAMAAQMQQAAGVQQMPAQEQQVSPEEQAMMEQQIAQEQQMPPQEQQTL